MSKLNTRFRITIGFWFIDFEVIRDPCNHISGVTTEAQAIIDEKGCPICAQEKNGMWSCSLCGRVVVSKDESCAVIENMEVHCERCGKFIQKL